MRPKWLQPNPRRLGAKLHPCGALVLTGLDEDVMGLPVEVDPQPLTPVGEALMIGAGRMTYTVESNRLYARPIWRISKYRHDEFDVLASHMCGAPIPAELTRPAKRTKPRKEYADECPF